LRPTLEVVQAFEKRPEDILHHVFRFWLWETQRFCSSQQWSRVFMHGFSKRFGITPAKAFKKFCADWNRGCHREPL